MLNKFEERITAKFNIPLDVEECIQAIIGIYDKYEKRIRLISILRIRGLASWFVAVISVTIYMAMNSKREFTEVGKNRHANWFR